MDKTFTDSEINSIQDSVREEIKNRLLVELRQISTSTFRPLSDSPKKFPLTEHASKPVMLACVNQVLLYQK